MARSLPGPKPARYWRDDDFDRLAYALLDGTANAVEYAANPKTFGDGLHDDALAIQAAVDDTIERGQGTVVVPGIAYVATMVDLTRAPEIDLSLVGMNATLTCTAGSTIEAVLKLARTGDQSLYRHHAEVKGLRIKGNSKAFYGIRVASDVGTDIVSMSNVYVEGCTVGLDVEGSMESHFRDLSLFANTTGLRLRPDVTGVHGGGNANEFVGVKITNGEVGIVLYVDHDVWPFHNNTFVGTLIQGVTKAGVVIAGVRNFNQVFTGGHFETNLTSPAGNVTVEVGDFEATRQITVKSADLVLLSSEATLVGLRPDSVYAAPHSEVEGSRSSALPQLNMTAGGLGGNWGAQNIALDYFGARDVTMDAVRVVTRHGTPHLREFYRSAVISEEIPGQAHGGFNEVAAHLEVHAPASKTDEAHATLGTVHVVDFDASAGSHDTNSYRRDISTAVEIGQFVYVDYTMQSDTDTSMRFGVTGEAAMYFVDIPLRAGKWTHVRFVTSRAVGEEPLSNWVHVHPTGTDGPTVRIARPYAAIADEPIDAATLFNGSVVL